MPVSSGLRAGERTRGARRSARGIGAGGTSDAGAGVPGGRFDCAVAAGATSATKTAARTWIATLEDRLGDRGLESRGDILRDDSHADRARIVTEQERAVKTMV